MIRTVPGDKSISQRALILAALADGESRLSGVLPGADPSSTAAALRALGAEIPPLPHDGGEIRVPGLGLRGLLAPSGPLDLGNSGTGARLLMGVLAGQPFRAVLTGDDSLRSRPMRRVSDPLTRMGASFEALAADGKLPMAVRGGALRPLALDLPVASAQVKSALLFAGLVGGVPVRLTEPGRSRDHTERMLRRVGVAVADGTAREGQAGRGAELRVERVAASEPERWWVELPDPPVRIDPLDFRVPGDVSSAAFLLVLALLGGAGRALTVRDVGLNPTRTGILPLLRRMGADLDVEGGEDRGDEPVGSITARPAALRGIELDARDVVGAIDEVPILVAAATRARGVTRVTGAGELRVKETDRIRALVEGLRAVGVGVEEREDGLELEGTERPLVGTIDAFHDHRIAMAFGVLGALPGNDIRVVGRGSVDVSFPGFWDTLAEVEREGEATGARSGSRSRPAGPRAEGEASSAGARRPVVTIDGPAGSGKSTTARAVARRLGYRHLDSGALYRALTWALLSDKIPPAAWPTLTAHELDRHRVLLVPSGGERFGVTLDGQPLGDAELRGPEVTSHVATVAGLPAVRAWLMERQREAGRGGGLVADGRDMGTVVFPDAAVKVFLTATLEERARRRLRDHGVAEPAGSELGEEGERIGERDLRDSEREIAPLRPAEDAWVLDTTGMAFEEQVDTIVERVEAHLARSP